MASTQMKFAAVSIVLLTLLRGSTPQAQESERPEWVSFPYEGLRRLSADQQLSRVEKIVAMARLLDQRFSVEKPFFAMIVRVGDKPRTSDEINADPTQRHGLIIAAIMQVVRKTDTTGEPATKPLETVIQQLDQMQDIKNKNEVRSYLYLALALAGGKAPEAELVSLVDDLQDSSHIAMSAMTVLLRSNEPPPIRILPAVLAMVDDPFNYFVSNIVNPDGTRVYPIRDLVYEVVTRLGIKAEKTFVEDKDFPGDYSDGRLRPKITIIKVDRQSLISKLREWMLSDDPKVWQAASEVIPKVPGDDAQAMVADLIQQDTLPEEKKRALAERKSG